MDGKRLKGEIVMMDKDTTKRSWILEEHVPVPKSVHDTRTLGGVRVHSEMSRVHVVAEEDGETSAHRKLLKAE